MKVIIASPFAPNAVGHGGHHRSYQIWSDAAQAVGEENLISVSGQPHWWLPSSDDDPGGAERANDPVQKLIHALKRQVRRQNRRFAAFVENPLKPWSHSKFQTNSCTTEYGLRQYRQLAASLQGQAVCIIEHSGFAELLPINAQYGIKTIGCLQNLESFDMVTHLPKAQRDFQALSLDFANELHVLAQCTERLFISRIETGLLGGLGFASHFYPYLPVGAIYKRLLELRHLRSQTPQTPGLMLLIGTAAHSTTGASMRWFVEQALAKGLPSGIKVVLAGAYTDQLLSGRAVTGLEARGWVEQEELDDLLVHAQAVLMPQRSGFGALTRVSEMVCAGLPVILSLHPTYGLALPPGVEVVEDVWSDWYAAMMKVGSQSPSHSSTGYDDWAGTQPRPLSPLLTQMLAQLIN